MVDECPSRLSSQALFCPEPHDHVSGIAALAPQFDQAINTPRRSVPLPPIGSLSPDSRSFAPPPPRSYTQPLASSLPKSYYPFAPPESHSHPNNPISSPPVAAADFLAECSSHGASSVPSHPHSASTSDPRHPFHLFGIANLDLGPPVRPSLQQPPSHSPVNQSVPSSSHLHHLPRHHHQQAYPYASQDLTLSLSPPRAPPHNHLRHFTTASSPQSAPPPSLKLSQTSLQQHAAHSHAHTHTHSHAHPPSSSSGSLGATAPPHPPPPPSPVTTTTTTSTSSPVSRPSRELAHPTRCVLLRNIPPGVDDDDLRALLQLTGPLRDLGAQQRSRGGRGSVLATYFDLRHARDAVRRLDGSTHFGRKIDARFQCPVDAFASVGSAASAAALSSSPGASGSCPSANQGTLVVFNLDVSTSAEDIRALFSKIGDVKEIRATPNKKHHKFVEFYDVRDAEKALLTLNKSEVAGKRIKIEISRPGGRASGLGRAAAAASKPVPIAGNGHWKAAATRGNICDGVGGGHGSLGSGIGNAHGLQYGLSDDRGSSYSSGGMDMRRASVDGNRVLGGGESGGAHVSSDDVGFGFNALSTSFPPLSGGGSSDRPDILGRETNGVPCFTHGAGDGLASSLDRSLKSLSGPDEDEMNTVYKLFGISGMEEKDIGHPVSHAKHVHESYMQALYHSASSDDGRGVGSGTDDSPGRTIRSDDHVGIHELHDDGLSNGGMDGGVGRFGSGGLAMKPGVGKIGGTNGMLANMGGNAGMCCSSPHSKYGLDIRRVRSGEETRTALMIRNIPNKYNQKMLVSTLEDGHKGHFDFIYLPIDFKNKCNVGYAFINLTKPEFIEGFYEAFHGKKWGRFNSEKVCEITFARIQGRQQLIAHFQNSSLLLEDPKCRPVIFDNCGRQEEFPIGSHVRTRRGPSSRDCGQRAGEPGSTSPSYSPPKHRGRG